MSSSADGLRLGTRDSELALYQARMVAALLQAKDPTLNVELVAYKTQGDRFLDASFVQLSRQGMTGVFVKELEQALLSGEIDLAVHSMKDMPSQLPEGLTTHSIGFREDPRDVLLLPDGKMIGNMQELPSGSRIGTSSARRVAQLKRLSPNWQFEAIRGNLQTRLRKLDESGGYDALVLAAAGVHRLGWESRIACYLNPFSTMVPAPAQGIVAVEYRTDNTQLAKRLSACQVPAVAVMAYVERSVMRLVEGGCQLPLGVFAHWPVEDDTFSPWNACLGQINTQTPLQVTACLLSPDGQHYREAKTACWVEPADTLEESCERLWPVVQSLAAQLRA
ncbi:MAG: hydroxymethylbilane synthase [Candidatus Melainabacteria bacterium]|nr:hydroxymethylbilane synthase [Candidatus Melainabacteria bacterium]